MNSIRPRFHAVFSFQNISVKMIFCPGYFLFFLAVFGRAMSEIIGKFVSQHNLSDEKRSTVQSRFSDILFSDKSRFSDNFAEDRFFST